MSDQTPARGNLKPHSITTINSKMGKSNHRGAKSIYLIVMTTCLLTWLSAAHCQQHSTEQQQQQSQSSHHQQQHNSFESLADHLNALATQQRHQQQQQLINNRLASALAALNSNSPTPSSAHEAAASHQARSMAASPSIPSSALPSANNNNWQSQLLASASTQTPTYASIYSPGSQYMSGAASSFNPTTTAASAISPPPAATPPTASPSSNVSPAALANFLYPSVGPLSYGQSHLYGSAISNPLASLGGNSLWSAYSSPLYANSLARSSYSPFGHLYTASPRFSSAANGYLSALQSYYGLGGGGSAATGAGEQGSSQGTDITSLLRSAAGSPYSSLFTREPSLFPSYSSSMYGAMSPSSYGQSVGVGYASPYSAGSPAGAAGGADPLFTSASNTAYGVPSPTGAGISPLTMSHASPFGGSGSPRITIQPLFGSGTSSYYSLLNPYGGSGSTAASALRSSLLGGKLGLGLGLAGLSMLG